LFGRLKRILGEGSRRIGKAISEKIMYREIKEDDIVDLLEETLLELVEAEVAYDTAYKITQLVKQKLVGKTVKRGENVEKLVINAFKEALHDILTDTSKRDILGEITSRCGQPGREKRPYIVMFLGVNGVGKTTTIAKMAYKLKSLGIRPVIAAADTFRAGAQEQLRKHAERLDIPFIGGKYGSDPASVVYDAIAYASARGYCVVFVDTAGRLHVDSDLMMELRKIARVAKPDVKILVVDALTGNDAIEQVRRFNDAIGIDGIILTKVDADVKGGTAISVISESSVPVFFLGVGQSYEDLEPFDPDRLLEKIFEK